MRRLSIAALVLPLVAGCGSVVREDADYFQAGADVGRFEADNQTCAIAADNYVTYDLKGMSGTGYAQNRAYNSVYSRCMTGRGYSPRPYARNWLNGG
jgi:hypothetical protein